MAHPSVIEAARVSKETEEQLISTIKNSKPTNLGCMREYIQQYLSVAIKAESDLYLSPGLDVNDCNSISREIFELRPKAVDRISAQYADKFRDIARVVVDEAEQRFSELINEMKSRDLSVDVSEKEIDDLHHGIVDKFNLNYRCAGKDSNTEAYINRPLLQVIKKVKERVRKEVMAPREKATIMSAEINANSKWKPDPVLVAKEIENGVGTLKETVRYMVDALVRTHGISLGFTKDQLNELMNARWLELQDRLLEKTHVRGTRFEDEVVTAFEKASVEECNSVRDTLYFRLVRERFDVAMVALSREHDAQLAFSDAGRRSVEEYRAGCNEILKANMSMWTIPADLTASFEKYLDSSVKQLLMQDKLRTGMKRDNKHEQVEERTRGEVSAGRQSANPSLFGATEGGLGGFSATYNEGAPQKSKVKAKALASTSVTSRPCTATPEMHMEVDAPASPRGSKRLRKGPSLSQEEEKEDDDDNNAGVILPAKKRRTSAVQSLNKRLKRDESVEVFEGDEDGDDGSIRQEPFKRRRTTTPPARARKVTAKLAPKYTEKKESALEAAKREAKEEVSRRAAEYVAKTQSKTPKKENLSSIAAKYVAEKEGKSPKRATASSSSSRKRRKSGE